MKVRSWRGERLMRAHRLACGVGEKSLPSLCHIVQVHDDCGNSLIAQLRMPPVLQPICMRLCTKQKERGHHAGTTTYCVEAHRCMSILVHSSGSDSEARHVSNHAGLSHGDLSSGHDAC